MRAELNDPYPIPLLVLQNNRDCVVVQPRGRQPAGCASCGVRGCRARHAGRGQRDEQACSPAFSSDFGCRQTFYISDGSARSLVETVFFNGPAATPNPADKDLGPLLDRRRERQGRPLLDPPGPELSRHHLGFLRASCPRRTSPGRPVITMNGANPMRSRGPDLQRSGGDRLRSPGRQRRRRGGLQQRRHRARRQLRLHVHRDGQRRKRETARRSVSSPPRCPPIASGSDPPRSPTSMPVGRCRAGFQPARAGQRHSADIGFGVGLVVSLHPLRRRPGQVVRGPARGLSWCVKAICRALN